MAEAQEKKQTGRKAATKGPSRWALAAVILLVVAATGGWVAYTLPRFLPDGETQPDTVTLPPATRQPQAASPNSTPNNNGPVITATPNQTTKPLAYGVVISQSLNVREAPTTAAAIIRPLKNGDIVELARRSGGWYQTTDGSWISAVFLEVRLTRAEAESYARILKSEV